MTGHINEAPEATPYVAMQVMTGAAKHASATLESLSSWMLAGFGAVLGLVLSQLQGLAPILDTAHVRFAGLTYVASVIPAFAAKVLGAMITATGNGAKEGADLGEKMDALGVKIDAQSLYALIYVGTTWPLTWINRKAKRLALSNDVAGMGRLARDRSNLQMRWVLLQIILTAMAAAVLVLGVQVT